MLEAVLAWLKNWFCKSTFVGNFIVSDGVLVLEHILDGQYVRIIGSVFNDGVYQNAGGLAGLTDEEFEGEIWGLAIPKDLLTLVSQIEEWTARPENAKSEYVSESFGGYSYSKKSEGSSSGGWQGVFAKELARWRKL